jgi:hypothetical protein
MVWVLARDRLDDIADAVWKLGQDLLRFLLRRCRVHARLAVLVTQPMATIIKCDFKTVN